MRFMLRTWGLTLLTHVPIAALALRAALALGGIDTSAFTGKESCFS